MSDLKRLLDLKGSTIKFEYDDRGYMRGVPTDEELKRIESYLATEIEKSIADHEPVFKEAAENIKTYRAAKYQIPESGETILPLPLAAIAADQIISWNYNTIMRPRPVVSFDAYFGDEYEVLVPLEMEAPMAQPDMGVMAGMPGMPPMDPMMGGAPGMGMGGPEMGMGGGMMGGQMPPMGPPQMVTVPVPTKAHSEEIARRLEQGFEWKVRERIPFAKIVQNELSDVIIAGKGYVKVCADRSTRTVYQPKVNGAVLDLEEKGEYSVKSKEAVKIYCLPIFNVLKPIAEDDMEESPWVAEKTPVSPDTFLGRVESGEYHLIDKSEGQNLAEMVTEITSPLELDVKATQGKPQTEGKKAIDLMEVQVRLKVKGKDPETGERVIKEYDFLAEWHHGAKRLCSLYKNPYDHQRRMIVPFYHIKDAHSDSGTCTVGRMKWHQKVATHAIQSEIKNAFHANNFSYWWVPGSEAADYFEAGKKLRAGEGIPGKEGEDWGVVRAGEGFTYSMLPLIQWTEGSGQRTSNVSSYEQGDAVPGRTPAATVSQILQQGLQQPLMFLRTFNESMVKVIRLYLETARQYQPFGETIPVRNQKTKEIMEIPFRFPVAAEGVDPLDNFRISLTAADEAMAKEHEQEAMLMAESAWQQFAQFVAQVAGPMANPAASPATVKLFEKIIDAGQTIFNKYISFIRTDEEKFDLSPEIDALVKEHEAAVQAQQMAAQNGMMNANPNAQGGAVQPGPGPGVPGGGGGMAPPPGDPGLSGPPPPEGIPV
jgi:hypothetical protein